MIDMTVISFKNYSLFNFFWIKRKSFQQLIFKFTKNQLLKE